MRARTLLGALVLMVAGCSTAGSGQAGDALLVPWNDAIPAALRPATLAPAPSCQASGLTVVGSGFQFQPAESGGTGRVTIRNAGTGACRLTGRPDARLIGAAPAPEQQQVPLPAQPPTFPMVVPPDTTLSALPPRAEATLDLDWRNWCLPQSSGTPVPPRAIRLTLPGGAGSIDVGYDVVPPCDTPGGATTLGVRPFQPAPLPTTTPWTSTALRATIQPLSGGNGRLRAERGGTARFVVQLHNPSAVPIGFDHCPLVVEMLAPAGQPETHQLNCRSAARLPARGSLRFEMRVQVPAAAPVGNNGLFWELDPTGGQGTEAVSRLVVAAP